MSEKLFCYCCQVHHPKEQMRLFRTRPGLRWRCIRSIEAAARSLQERESFGRRQSAINREESRRMAERAALLRHEARYPQR